MANTHQIQSSLFELMFLIKIEMKKVLKNVDDQLSPIEVLVLRALVEYGETTPQLLTKRVSKDKSQITRTLKSLENKQLITKRPNPLDKRSIAVFANQSVKDKMAGFIEYEKKLVEVMLEGASAEQQDSLESVLGLMMHNIKASA